MIIVGRKRSEVAAVNGDLCSRSNQAKRGALIRSVGAGSDNDARDHRAEGGVGDRVGGIYSSGSCHRYVGVGSHVIHRGSNAGGRPRHGGCCQTVARDDNAAGRTKVGPFDDERHPRCDAALLSAMADGVSASSILDGDAGDGGRLREGCGSKPAWGESYQREQTKCLHGIPPVNCDRGHWSEETGGKGDSGTVVVIDSSPS